MTHDTAHAPIHLLDHGRRDPAWNMALDLALLRARNQGVITGTWVRLFAWEPPAISLGRLQDAAGELDAEQLAMAPVAIVRRATGGKAVYHADELTYSVVGGVPDPDWGENLHETYRSVTAIIAGGLERLGVAVHLAPRRPPRATAAAASAAGASAAGAAIAGGGGGGDLRAACFAVAFGHELVHGGRKICGSAQRRLVRAFLQHGSLLLGPEHARLAIWVRSSGDRRQLAERLRADTTDVSAAIGRRVDYDEASRAVRASLEDRFGERVRPGRLPAAVVAAAERERTRMRVEWPAAAITANEDQKTCD